MIENYVTIFDNLFLPQGLALYTSLSIYGGDFTLWIICVDDMTFDFFLKVNLPHIKPLKLSSLESTYLLSLKETRSRAEYCWTLTPCSIQWIFEQDISINRVTYLDADTFFLKSPESIFADFFNSNKSFLVTEHAYSPDMDQTPTCGRFCVQFISVIRDSGFPPLLWWRDKCFQQCTSSPSNGLFGDQTYIEELSLIFNSLVLNLKNDSRFLAPWNASIYRFSDAVLYHFQGFRILPFSTFLISRSSTLPQPVVSYVYRPYISLLKSFSRKYSRFGFSLRSQLPLTPSLFIRVIFSTFINPCTHFLSKLARLAIVLR